MQWNILKNLYALLANFDKVLSIIIEGAIKYISYHTLLDLWIFLEKFLDFILLNFTDCTICHGLIALHWIAVEQNLRLPEDASFFDFTKAHPPTLIKILVYFADS